MMCLPEKSRRNIQQLDARCINEARDSVNRAALGDFEMIGAANPLISFVSEAGECNRRVHGPLLLLFDRADVVPPPSLPPVFRLLDQAGSHIVLLATRPGIGGEPLARISQEVVPGDHYDILSLGLYPRAPDWTNFVQLALEAQFGSQLAIVPEEIRNCIMVYARDSTKVAVDLMSHCLADSANRSVTGFIKLLQEFREDYLTAAQATLRTYVDNFGQSIRRIYNRMQKEHKPVTPGVLVTFRQRVQPPLFQILTTFDLFVDAALRSWALCMPDGQRWIPGSRPAQVEIPPLFMWPKDDKPWTSYCPPTSISISVGDLTGHGGPPSPPTIFIAYRMTFERSQQFRQDLEARMRSHPMLSNATFFDGNVPYGAKWPLTIRERISKAHVMVADVQGMRPDILFEIGFAYGLGKALILAFEGHPNAGDIPVWLKGRQIGHYGDGGGLDGIVAGVVTHLSDPEFNRPTRPPQPVPSLVVWLRVLDWNKLFLDQLKTAANREGLDPEVYTDDQLTSENIIRRAASASLLVLSLDGTSMDDLTHYVAGAIVSKPLAGRGSASLPRRVIVLETKPRTFAALSLQKCEDDKDTVDLVNPTQALSAAKRFFDAHKKWSSKVK